MQATEVLTTLILKGDTTWTLTPMSFDPDKYLLQDADQNMGILGDLEQIDKMLDMMALAVHQAKGLEGKTSA